MRKQRIVVFPCGSEIGLEIYRSLANCKEVELWGASSVEDHGCFVYSQYVQGLPFVDHPNFIGDLNKIIRKMQIDFIFPAHDSAVLRLSEAAHSGALECPVLTSPFSTCYICRSKRRTIELLSGRIPVPRVFNSIDDVDQWPVFVKPDQGQGSRGAFIAENRDQIIRGALDSPGGLIIQEHLAGDEYTIDCFTDASGALVYQNARKRARITNGISVATASAAVPELADFAERINQCLKFRGVWFFQMKRGCGGIKLLEVAPRVAGSMSLQRIQGVNLPLMTIYDACGYPVEAVNNGVDVMVDRALDVKFKTPFEFARVFVDLDDCLIINGKINADLVSFLLRCVNAGKTIHLLTRHRGALNDTLKGARLSALFDSVQLIPEGSKKSKWIASSDSIFIDDSFAERMDVYRSRGIPVFAPDAVAGWHFHFDRRSLNTIR